MKRQRKPTRRGMTLVELTVVVVILCLLAVTVLPVLNRSPNESLLRDAAATVQGHIAQGISKSIGSRTGYGVWFDADPGVTVSATATTLAFCPGMTSATGASQVKTAIPFGTATSATLTPGVSNAVLGGGPATFPTGTLVTFTGFPYEYQLDSSGSIASLRSDAMQTINNTSFPYNTGTSSPMYSWVVSVPPTRTLGMKTALRGNACIDLGCSSVGVSGYSNPATLAADNPSSPLTSPLVLTFDSTGQASAAIYIRLGDSQKFRRLDPETPIALLIGLADQVGNNWVTKPTEDDPGSNLQRADALWVVYDPRTSTSFVVENYVAASAVGAISSAHITNAQKFVRQALLNRQSAN